MLNEYATGKKVYKGGLHNAQSGTLNPEGYIQRGISQRRSGKAAAMLRILDKRKAQSNAPSLPVSLDNLAASGLTTSPVGKIRRLGQE